MKKLVLFCFLAAATFMNTPTHAQEKVSSQKNS